MTGDQGGCRLAVFILCAHYGSERLVEPVGTDRLAQVGADPAFAARNRITRFAGRGEHHHGGLFQFDIVFDAECEQEAILHR